MQMGQLFGITQRKHGKGRDTNYSNHQWETCMEATRPTCTLFIVREVSLEKVHFILSRMQINQTYYI